MIKYSRQREAIKLHLQSRKDHPTAEMVYSSIKDKYPKLSLGTVYRNLTFLCDHGDAIKISCGDSSEHFDGNATPHHHFICRICNCVEDIEMDDISFINTLASKKFDGIIEGNTTFFYGLCKKCKKK